MDSKLVSENESKLAHEFSKDYGSDKYDSFSGTGEFNQFGSTNSSFNDFDETNRRSDSKLQSPHKSTNSVNGDNSSTSLTQRSKSVKPSVSQRSKSINRISITSKRSQIQSNDNNEKYERVELKFNEELLKPMSYSNNRSQLISQLSKLKGTKILIRKISLGQKENAKYNIFVDKNVKIKNELSFDEYKSNADDFNDDFDGKSERGRKSVNYDYLNKLALPNKKVDNKKNSRDLVRSVRSTPCTCEERLRSRCTPLHPNPGCARITKLFSTEDERENCSFKPNINKFHGKSTSKGDFVQRQEESIRMMRKKMERARGEQEYGNMLNKKVCPQCGAIQSYEQYSTGKNNCMNCHIKFVTPLRWESVEKNFYKKNDKTLLNKSKAIEFTIKERQYDNNPNKPKCMNCKQALTYAESINQVEHICTKRR